MTKFPIKIIFIFFTICNCNYVIAQANIFVYFENSHVRWFKDLKMTKGVKQKLEANKLILDTIVFTKDSMFLKYKEYNHFNQASLEKRIAFLDILKTKKQI